MSDPVAVSIVLPVRDEAARVASFLDAHRWAADIVVVDNGSHDDTAAVAAGLGARVLSCPGMSIGAARNAGAEAAACEWILALDIDEVAGRDIAAEIGAVLAAPRYDAYRLRRRNFYLGREQRRGSLAHDWIVRLYRRRLRFTTPKVHEVLDVAAPVGVLRGTLRHEPYSDLAHHLSKMNRYARWGAEELYARGRRASLAALIGRPVWRFWKAYFIYGHMLDGRAGLVVSMLDAQSAFLKYAHLWALEGEPAGRGGKE